MLLIPSLLEHTELYRTSHLCANNLVIFSFPVTSSIHCEQTIVHLGKTHKSVVCPCSQCQNFSDFDLTLCTSFRGAKQGGGWGGLNPP